MAAAAATYRTLCVSSFLFTPFFKWLNSFFHFCSDEKRSWTSFLAQFNPSLTGNVAAAIPLGLISGFFAGLLGVGGGVIVVPGTFCLFVCLFACLLVYVYVCLFVVSFFCVSV